MTATLPEMGFDSWEVLALFQLRGWDLLQGVVELPEA
jgi:hypothetical protein